MCGISGSITTLPGQALERVVAEIVESQQRRGPDAEAVECFNFDDRQLVFGHNRLAIIDLDPESNQPLSDIEGRFSLIFNGEIYNYIELRRELEAAGRTFRTKSDSEVLLAAFAEWGTGSFNRFLGMFAFAILDRRTRELFIVRDRFGVKPLLYWHDRQRLLFASSAQVIARYADLAPRLDYVSRGLQYKYYEDETDFAPFEGLKAVPAGHFLRVDLEADQLRLKSHRYYDLEAGAAAREHELARRREGDLTEELRELLLSACKLRLRADVPVGLSLSGGLDSTSIAALCAQNDARLIAFSYGDPNETDSEGPLVRLAADRFDIPVEFVNPTGKAELEKLFWSTLYAQGAPFPHTSMLAQHAVYERARASGIKVLLGGQGGDEALMGYRKFFLFEVQRLRREGKWADLARFGLDQAAVALAILKRANVFWSERSRFAGDSGGMGTRLRLPTSTAPSPALQADQSMLHRQALDVVRYSLPSLLRYEDRNSMANSIESRLPFMDHRLMEFGLALPTRMKLRAGYGKHILRAAMKGQVPDDIRLSRDKRGFDTRQRDWIQTGLGEVIRDALEERRSLLSDFLPDQPISTLFSDESLSDHPQAFKEATSLLWLSDPTRLS